MEELIIRDFLYVDEDRLYSLYSQVFEGVAESIVESVIASLASIEEQRGLPLKGSTTEEKVAEATRRTESKTLYDYMYSRLEKRLDAVIVDVSELDKVDFRQVLKEAFLIKVTGTAEISDYRRLELYVERFNEIADAIGYSSLSTIRESAKGWWKERERQISDTKDKNERAKLQRKFKADKNSFDEQLNSLLEKNKLRQDEAMLANIRMLVEIFHENDYEITIVPASSYGEIVYTGVINKNWLRIQPEYIRSLYGAAVNSRWTLVGKVTYIPDEVIDDLTPDPNKNIEISRTGEGDKASATKPNSGPIEFGDLGAIDEIPSADTGDKSPAMRGSFRNMFMAAHGFDKIFLESDERAEVLVAPLAIYHEVSIPSPNDISE